jgi:orotidine-5'-phosphate decarboxylase
MSDRHPLAEHLCLALDVDDLDLALSLAGDLSGLVAVAKVGLELYSAAGPRAVEALTDAGFDVFVDLKLHDIPTTVRKAARVLGGLGARYATLHTVGGEAMLTAGVEGFADGADAAGLASPVALGVTVLTSDPDASPELLRHRAAVAAAAGCGGIVCAAPDLEILAGSAPGLIRVVPGTRPAGSSADDQARTLTPGQAYAQGAGLLVIGRVVMNAPDPRAAAEELLAELEGASV